MSANDLFLGYFCVGLAYSLCRIGQLVLTFYGFNAGLNQKRTKKVRQLRSKLAEMGETLPSWFAALIATLGFGAVVIVSTFAWPYYALRSLLEPS